jgi:transcriptional regulator with XRE-family HTH domain
MVPPSGHRSPAGARHPAEVDRPALAAFLRNRRARVQPADVGLAAGPRRRTPGLRREEVARLAAISVDYYIRLEQGRGPRPSRSVLTGLARALRLSDVERGYLLDLAGEGRPPAGTPPRDVPAGIVHLLERLDDTPAYVMDAAWDILAWNPMAAALITELLALPEQERNGMRWLFLPGAVPGQLDADHERLAWEAVADLRVAAARYPDAPRVAALIAELSAASPLFVELWDRHDVQVRRSTHKRTHHPVVGPIDLDIETLIIPERDQRLVLYTAAPGTPSHEALRLLRVVGTQDLSPAK